MTQHPDRPTNSTAELPTDLAAPRAKLFAGARAVVERIDPNDVDQVFDLAVVLQCADTRRLMQATHDELRAIAAAAARDGVIASQATRLVALVDGDGTVAEIVAQRQTLYDAVRAAGLTLKGEQTNGEG